MAASMSPLDLASSLVGSRVVVVLKNEREFDGVLRGFDDFLNMVLDDVCELDGDSAAAPPRRRSILLNGSTVCLLIPQAAAPE